MFNETFFLLLLFRYFFFAFIIIQSLAWVIFSFFFFFNPSKIEKRKTGKKNYNNFSFSRPVSKKQGSIDNLYIYIIRRQNWFQNESSCYSFERVTCFRLMSRWWKKRKEKKRKKSIVDSVKNYSMKNVSSLNEIRSSVEHRSRRRKVNGEGHFPKSACIVVRKKRKRKDSIRFLSRSRTIERELYTRMQVHM